MNNTTYTDVSAIIRRVLNNSQLLLKPEDTSKSIAAWDSLRHVMIVSEIEKKFGIRFDLVEMLDIESVADICNAIERKTAAQ